MACPFAAHGGDAPSNISRRRRLTMRDGDPHVPRHHSPDAPDDRVFGMGLQPSPMTTVPPADIRLGPARYVGRVSAARRLPLEVHADRGGQKCYAGREGSGGRVCCTDQSPTRARRRGVPSAARPTDRRASAEHGRTARRACPGGAPMRSPGLSGVEPRLTLPASPAALTGAPVGPSTSSADPSAKPLMERPDPASLSAHDSNHMPAAVLLQAVPALTWANGAGPPSRFLSTICPVTPIGRFPGRRNGL